MLTKSTEELLPASSVLASNALVSLDLSVNSFNRLQLRSETIEDDVTKFEQVLKQVNTLSVVVDFSKCAIHNERVLQEGKH